jgi:TRAP-type transport system small permease protein
MRQFVRRLERGLALLGRISLVISLLIVLGFTCAQVVDRYGPSVAFNAWDQIAQLALVWVTFIGVALAIRDRANIRVDLIDGWLGGRLVAVRDRLADLLAIGLLVVIQAEIWRLVDIGGRQVIMGTPFTMSATFLALALGSGLAIALLTLRLVLAIVDGARR